MNTPAYRTSPQSGSGLPPGIPYIVANEAAERFSYYGMRTILVVFMTQYLRDASGELDVLNDAQAKAYYHTFSSAVYLLPMLGALLADGLLGKYRTILALSVVYCLGHLTLALDETHFGLTVGLGLIALGSGGIKPCVSAHVGDQFSSSNAHLLDRVYGWFYFAINLGAFASTLLTPWLLANHGPGWAFGVPGLLMAAATLVFWIGRHRFIHIPPGGRRFIQDVFSPDGLAALGRLIPIYAFVAMFWALYDQTGSAWVLQAAQMDRHLFGIDWLSSQIQAVNPILIMALIPIFSYVVYPALERVIRLTALRKIAMGLFLTVPAFLLTAWIEWRIGLGEAPNIAWQIGAFVIITAAEVLVSIPCLEFSYTQAPARMKSFVMAGFFMSVALGNVFTAAVNFFLQRPDGTLLLDGASYYLFFAALMATAALAFLPLALRFKERSYLQESG